MEQLLEQEFEEIVPKEESLGERLENGKRIYELFKKNQDLKLSQIIQKLEIADNRGRIDFWLYIMFVKVGIKDALSDREHILNDYKGYIILNYNKFFREVNLFGHFTEDFKKYLIDFFLKTYTLTDTELKKTVEKEISSVFMHYVSMKQYIKTREEVHEMFVEENKELKEEVEELRKKITEKEEIERTNEETRIKKESFSFTLTVGKNVQILAYVLMLFAGVIILNKF